MSRGASDAPKGKCRESKRRSPFLAAAGGSGAARGATRTKPVQGRNFLLALRRKAAARRPTAVRNEFFSHPPGTYASSRHAGTRRRAGLLSVVPPRRDWCAGATKRIGFPACVSNLRQPHRAYGKAWSKTCCKKHLIPRALPANREGHRLGDESVVD